MENCDTLLIIGSSFPYIEIIPKPGRRARAVQIELDPERIGLRYAVEVGLKETAAHATGVDPRFERNENRGFLETAQKGMKEWRKMIDERARRHNVPMKPQVIAHEIGERLREDAIVSPIPEPIRPGGPGTYPVNADRSIRFPAISPPWPRLAIYDRRADRLSGPPVHSVCGRWRIPHVDG